MRGGRISKLIDSAPAVVISGWILCSSVTAIGQQTQDERETQARAECSAGRYERGVDILARLFAETSEPTYVYNQGRCYEENGRLEQAGERFREYVRQLQGKPESEGEIRESEVRIKDLEDRIARRRATAPSPTPVITVQALPAPTTAPAPLHRRPWFWVAVGALAAGTATAFLLATRHTGQSSFTCPDCGLGTAGVP